MASTAESAAGAATGTTQPRYGVRKYSADLSAVGEPWLWGLGGALAIAIAIHNIPEGLCVSIPIYFATGDRWKAFRWALLSGISEPIGALIGWLILKDHFNELVYGIVFGMVAGMMVMIVLNELVPTAHRYDPHDKVVTKSISIGMVVMAASLCLFVYG